ncbi:hypothetical protein MRY87_08175 [bacterium]|nr:hypothetical protein [bacterium]
METTTVTGIFCLFFGCSALIFGVLRPLSVAHAHKRGLRSQEEFELAKVLAVRHYYPGLHKLTPEELRDQFDVEAAYANIGRRRT